MHWLDFSVARAIAEAVGRRVLSAGAHIRSQGSPRGICGRRLYWDGSFTESFGFPYQYSPTAASYSCIVSGTDSGAISGHSFT
jgi:hypothetical protein